MDTKAKVEKNLYLTKVGKDFPMAYGGKF